MTRRQARRPAAGFRVCCDSIAALAPLVRDGGVLFAKNSDRPALECQPLRWQGPSQHQAGSALRCQYIDIEQVAHCHGFIGAGPHWLWGLEQGVNDQGVAVGNHSIYTKDPLATAGLTGMDLVRLALERGDSAREAIAVVTELIGRYGQGGSGFIDIEWPYHNSFLVADCREAYLLEASGSHWALKKAGGGGLSASNHTVIGRDWELLSEGCERHAAEQGWCEPDGERFDFAAAYRDLSTVPQVVSSGRYAVTCKVLDGVAGGLDAAALMRVMRDHYGQGYELTEARSPDSERRYSVCMHADPVGTTTASMVCRLDQGATGVVWMAPGSPCLTPYLPVFVEGRPPPELLAGGSEPNSGGAWWRFKALSQEVARDPGGRAGVVRERWSGLESAWRDEAAELAARLPNSSSERGAMLGDFMQSAWAQASAELEKLTSQFAGLK